MSLITDVYPAGKLYDLVNIYSSIKNQGVADPIKHIKAELEKISSANDKKIIRKDINKCPVCGGGLMVRIITLKKGVRNQNGYKQHIFCGSSEDCLFEKYFTSDKPAAIQEYLRKHRVKNDRVNIKESLR